MIQTLEYVVQACINQYHGSYGAVRKVFTREEAHEVNNVRFTEGYLFGYLFIIFRGTHDNDGWVSNLNYKQISLPMFGRKAKVHGGLFWEVQPALSTIIEIMRRHSGPVIIGGHSKGGAHAILAAAILKYMYNAPIEWCIPVAMPRVGNRRFRKIYRNMKINTVCLWYKNDPVPHLPFKKTPAIFVTQRLKYLFTQFSYCHVTKPLRLGHTTWRDWLGSMLVNFQDHRPDRYLRGVKELR